MGWAVNQRGSVSPQKIGDPVASFKRPARVSLPHCSRSFYLGSIARATYIFIRLSGRMSLIKRFSCASRRSLFFPSLSLLLAVFAYPRALSVFPDAHAHCSCSLPDRSASGSARPGRFSRNERAGMCLRNSFISICTFLKFSARVYNRERFRARLSEYARESGREREREKKEKRPDFRRPDGLGGS